MACLTSQPKMLLFWVASFVPGNRWHLLINRLKCCMGLVYIDHLLVFFPWRHKMDFVLVGWDNGGFSAGSGCGVAPWPLQEDNRLFLTGGWLMGQMGALRPVLSHLRRGRTAGPEAVQQPHPGQRGQVLRGSEGEIPILQPGALPQLRWGRRAAVACAWGRPGWGSQPLLWVIHGHKHIESRICALGQSLGMHRCTFLLG